jgi:hypothetical protein
MTRQEFIEEIMRLPVAERIALLEAISRSLREEFEADDKASHVSAPDAADERERRMGARAAAARHRQTWGRPAAFG